MRPNLFARFAFRKAVFVNCVGSSSGEPAGADTGLHGAGTPSSPGAGNEEARVETNHGRVAATDASQ